MDNTYVGSNEVIPSTLIFCFCRCFCIRFRGGSVAAERNTHGEAGLLLNDTTSDFKHATNTCEHTNQPAALDNQNESTQKTQVTQTKGEPNNYMSMTITEAFSTPCLHAHVAAALQNEGRDYLRHMQFLIESGTFSALPGSVRSRVLVALHVVGKSDAWPQVLPLCEVTEILSALKLLDLRRVSRQIAVKIAKIENEHPRLIELPEDAKRETSNMDRENITRKRKQPRKIDEYRKKLRSVEADIKNYCQNGASTCVESAHANSAVQEMIDSAPGVSGALARKVRHWAKGINSDALEFIMLSMPNKKPWLELADLVHFSPNDFAVSYFLADVHGDPIPEDSFVSRMRAFAAKYDSRTTEYEDDELAANFLSISKEFKQVYLAYRYLRTLPFLQTSKEVYRNLALHVPLASVIWDFEEFYRVAPKMVPGIVLDRLRRKELGVVVGVAAKNKVTTFGKLMERILTLQRMGQKILANELLQMAEDRLRALTSYWSERVASKKVVVEGDASASMQCAIESSAIFSSLVSVCFDGTLRFYNSRMVPSPHPKPKSAVEALEVCNKVKATNCTAPASGLLDLLVNKTWVDMLVHVTDEGENTNFKGFSHAQVLAKYKEEVNPNLKVVIVRVGSGYRPFQEEMTSLGVEFQTVVIDGLRPDLAKFDSLLGQLAGILGIEEEEADEESLTNVEVANAVTGPNKDEEEFVVV